MNRNLRGAFGALFLFAIVVSILIILPDGMLTNAHSLTATLPPTFKARVVQPTYCYNGPGENYPLATIVPADLMVDVLGATTDTMDWFMVQEQSINRCWIREGSISHDNIDVNKILKFTTASTISESVCYTGPGNNYVVQTRIPGGWKIVLYEKNNSNADWVFVTPHDSTKPCWVTRGSLTQFDASALLVGAAFGASTITPTTTPTSTPILTSPTELATTHPSELNATWNILSYECNNVGRAIRVYIDLDVSGGLPPYGFSREVPFYAEPDEPVSIVIKSNLKDGEPSTVMSFRVPSASDPVFKCSKPGSNPGPTPRPTSFPSTNPPPTNPPATNPPPTNPPPTNPPPTNPPPPTPTLCWPPGKCK